MPNRIEGLWKINCVYYDLLVIS